MNITQEPRPYFERQGLILDSGLPPNERFVLLVINEYSSADGTGAFPKQKTIAEKTGYSRKTVNQCIKRLEAKSLISQSRNYRDDGGWRNSNYTVHWNSVKTYGEKLKANKINAVTQGNRGCNDSTQGGVTEGYSISTHKDLPNSSHLYRTAFSPKSASSDFLEEEKKEIPKPKKRALFDEASELDYDHNGWIELPKAQNVAPAYREVIGLIKTQSMLWTKLWLTNEYTEELGLTIEWDEFTNTQYVSGLQFDNSPWNEFLEADGPMPVKLMRDILESRSASFQEGFNHVLSHYFWQVWQRFTSKAA